MIEGDEEVFFEVILRDTEAKRNLQINNVET